MTISTKIMLALLFVGAMIQGLYLNNYKASFGSMLIIIMVLLTWYSERK